MAEIISLWLPILVAAVIVFVASSVIHMAPLWHKKDFAPVPNEAEVMNALRPFATPPGDYFIPFTSDMKEMKSPEFTAKMTKGPVALMTVLPNGPVTMGRQLVRWFIFLLVIGIFAAAVAGHTLPAGTSYIRVFKVVGVTSFMGYALALTQNSIWLRRSWTLTLKSYFDGLIYAGLTAGTFGWLWPR